MKRMIWLASYPKSGNTWFRAFLQNLLTHSDAPININQLDAAYHASSRLLFEETIGLYSSEMPEAQIQQLQPKIYTYLAEHTDETLYLKVHDAYLEVSKEKPLFPPEITQSALYFIRNPLDVAVSYAHHGNVSIEVVIKAMADEGHTLCALPRFSPIQLRQNLLSWSSHVQSWTSSLEFPLQVIRYEDMIDKTLGTFTTAAKFIGLSRSVGQIERAVNFSRFEELQQQEEINSFCEKSLHSKSFFRRGQTGSWREILTPDQVQSIISTHGSVMSQFGYLNPSGQILV